LLARLQHWVTGGFAQNAPEQTLDDVLCDQCPYDAPVRPAAPDVFAPEIKSLGVTSVQDMIEQLPGNVASVRGFGVSCSDARSDADETVTTIPGLNIESLCVLLPVAKDEEPSDSADDADVAESSDDGDAAPEQWPRD